MELHDIILEDLLQHYVLQNTYHVLSPIKWPLCYLRFYCL